MIEQDVSPVTAADPESRPTGRFVGPDGRADVAVVVVTYRSGRDLGRLLASLRGEAEAQTLRVVVADNASPDDTLGIARAHDDVIAVETGGNLGYAGGINVALRHVGDADAILVLNPDLVVEAGCIAALRARLATSGAGVVVPRFLEGDEVFTSLRREPSVLGAIGDSVFGERFTGRPGALSEWVLDRGEYAIAHTVDWATGAALLIDGAVAREVGEWDERFFLYSEETDFFRRVRDAGSSVWYEPDAVVRHERGGSGGSVDLDRLVTVNRVRYFRKHHSRPAAAVFRAATALHQLARAYSATYRPLLASVIDESSWPTLPRGGRIPSPEAIVRARGIVVIAGEDAAAAAVGRTLQALEPFAASPELRVEVVGLGAEPAASLAAVNPWAGFAGAEPARFAGDAAIRRLLIPAGLEPDPATVVDTLDALEGDRSPAAVPPHEWTLEGASPLVRAYAWLRPRRMLAAPPAPGVMAVAGGDDRETFEGPPSRPRLVATNPVRVPVPRTVRALRRAQIMAEAASPNASPERTTE